MPCFPQVGHGVEAAGIAAPSGNRTVQTTHRLLNVSDLLVQLHSELLKLGCNVYAHDESLVYKWDGTPPVHLPVRAEWDLTKITGSFEKGLDAAMVFEYHSCSASASATASERSS